MSQPRPAGAASLAAGAPPAGNTGEQDRAGPALALRNWRVPWRLIALIVIPAVAGMVFAGLRVSVAAGSAATFGRVEQLASAGQQVTGLAQAMEDERDLSAVYIAAGRPAAGLAALRAQYSVTSARAAKVAVLARGVGAGFPAQARAAAAGVLARIGDLPGLRRYATGSQAPPLTVITGYSLAVADLFTLDDDIAQQGGNAGLVASVRALGALGRMKDQASQQQAILATALVAGRFGPGALAALTAAQAQQAADLASFQASATLSESQAFGNTVAGPLVDQAQALEQTAIVTGGSGGALSPASSRPWDTGMSDTVARMRAAERQLAGAIVAQARALHRGAERSAALTGGAAFTVLVCVLLLTVIIARSLVRPLRLLKAGALEVAGVRLPGEVRQLSEDGADVGGGVEVEPIGVHSTDEIGQVARAFDQVHREAVRLASDEARLRGSFSAMCVSLARRSQSLLERLLRLIDSLELGEEDPGRLDSLFRMDHLATRMRRHSENLLVLAGQEPPRRPAGPVPLVDVARGAASEIEQYDRVDVSVQAGITVAGNAASDLVHLLAELLENAAAFSAPATRVTVSGYAHDGGGALIGVTDSGMGMTDGQLAELNWRLENPPAADVAVARHMGLFAVAHLAARHGIRVRLQTPPAGGLTAYAWIPGALTAAGAGAAPRQPGPVPRVPARAQPVTRVPGMPARAGVTWPAAARPAAGQAARLPDPGAPLPIFDGVESDWFRARRGLPRRGAAPAAGPSPARPWTSRGDDGWRAAEAAALAPAAGGITAAGLPRRTPAANLVPGAAGDRAASPATRAEPAEVARRRLAGLQRGSRRARAAQTPDPAP